MQHQDLTPEQAAALTPEQRERLARGVLFEVVTAPDPVLVITGHTAVISNVRFLFSDHCASCRTLIRGWIDGGTITMGLRVSNSQKTVRWFETNRVGGRPARPEACPACGENTYARFSREPQSVSKAQPLQNKVHMHIRSTYPDLVAKADRAAGIVPLR